MPLTYVDSSVALAIGFAQLGHEALRAVHRKLTAAGTVFVSSELLRVEVHRVCWRETGSLEQAEEICAWVNTVPITRAITSGAKNFETHIKTLDALHLATAITLLPGSELRLWATDNQLRRAAQEYQVPLVDETATP